jgi:preprotein translocase SecE subunit
VLAFFLVATVLTAVLYSKLFAALFPLAGLKNVDLVGTDVRNSPLTLSTLFALIFTVVTLIYSLRATAAYEFVKQVAEELVKVTWPTLDEAKSNTFNTIVVTLIIGVILFSFDSFFGALTNLLLTSPT